MGQWVRLVVIVILRVCGVVCVLRVMIIHFAMGLLIAEFMPNLRTREHVSTQTLICGLIVTGRSHWWLLVRWLHCLWVVLLAALDCTFEIQFGFHWWHKCNGPVALFALGQ